MKGRTQLFASARVKELSARDDWQTPQQIRIAATAAFGSIIELDPCADADPFAHHLALNHYSGPAGNGVDGLREPWRARTVYINPPYSQARQWAEKLSAEWEAERFEQAIMLLPARTDTRAWQAATASASSICLITGRVRFVEPPSTRPASAGAPFPSALIYVGYYPHVFAAACRSMGRCWQPLRAALPCPSEVAA